MDDFYYLKGSPWSLKTMWSVSLLSDEVRKSVNLKPTLSANGLSSKLVNFLKKHDLKDEVKDADGKTLMTLPIFFHEPTGRQFIVNFNLFVLGCRGLMILIMMIWIFF